MNRLLLLLIAVPLLASTGPEKDLKVRESFLKRFHAARKHARAANTEVQAVTAEWMKLCESRNQQLQLDNFSEPDCVAKPAPPAQAQPAPPAQPQPPK